MILSTNVGHVYGFKHIFHVNVNENLKPTTMSNNSMRHMK
jgi:hypothetical protein